ncbi:MAG: DUF1573 domain-containing protein [Bacteroidales bacterium]|jgi:hypothetical protein|nr:DUF1573 domain-containing protein [Bacteroidales bacterium]
MTKLYKYICSIVLAIATVTAAAGNPPARFADVIEFDRTVFDFGDIMLSDGPVSCTFNAKNIGKKAIAIYNVVSSCGCTGVKWTREPILPGKTGKITATYSNDEGAFPFDKTLTVYVSNVKRPIVLRLRGVSHKEKLSPEKIYCTRFGILGIKDPDIKCGNMQQGEQKSGEIVIANLGKVPADVSFEKITKGMALSVTPNPIPPKSTGKLTYTITSDRSKWGRNYYYATPVINGKSYKAVITAVQEVPNSERGALNATDINPELGQGKSEIGIWTFTKENFSGWSATQIDSAAQPMFDASTCSLGKIKKGLVADAVFPVKNSGLSVFKIYKIDSDNTCTSVISSSPVLPAEKGNLRIRVDTSSLTEGETLIMLTLTTNSPLRPVINLFITGWII